MKKLKKFCDYCHDDCTLCNEGAAYLDHAKTKDGKWICYTCFEYDVCLNDKTNTSGPCENHNCKHRPKIVGSWIPGKDK